MITIEPSKRPYDPASRERLVELFGEPERWASTTTSFRWAQAEALVPALHWLGRVRAPRPLHLRPRARGARSTSTALAEGAAPLRFHFNGTVFYEGDDGRHADRPDAVGPLRRASRCRSTSGAQTIDAAYPFRAWVPVDTETLDAPRAAARPSAGLPTFDAAARGGCSTSPNRGPSDARAARAAGLVAALRGLRALPLHARGDQERHPDPVRDRLPARLRRRSCPRRTTTCGSRSCSRPTPRPSWRRRCASCRRPASATGGRAPPGARPVGVGAARRRRRGRGLRARTASRRSRARVRLRADALEQPGSGACAPAFTTPPTREAGPRALRGARRQPALDPRRDRVRSRALRLAARARRTRRRGGRGLRNVNTLPVLAAPGRRRGARRRRSCFPTTPRLAPESLGNLFDNTEIEEALLLHVQALSDAGARGDRRAGPGGARDDRAGCGRPTPEDSALAAWSDGAVRAD